MKNKLLLLTLILTPILLQAQWRSLGSDNIPNQSDNVIMGIHAPSEDVVWGYMWNLFDFSPNQQFIKSTDGGQTITKGTITVDDPSLIALGIFALDENTAWVGMVSEPCQCYGQIYKTTDGGDTWTELLMEDSDQSLGGVYFWNENEGIVYGSDGTGQPTDQLTIYQTSDGGENWIAITPSDVQTGEGMWLGSGSGYFDVVGDNVWIGTRGGRVFKSSDRGSTWAPSETFGAGRMINSVAFKNENEGLAFSSVSSAGFTSTNKAWKTFDGGTTWEEISIPNTVGATSTQFVPGTLDTYVFTGGFISDGMGITTNGGKDWKTITAPRLVCNYFISPTVGYAGGSILNDNQGGLYKFVSSLDPSHTNVTTLVGSTLEGVRRGEAATTRLWNPKGMDMDEEGNIYLADDYSNEILKISPSGEVSTLASGFSRPHGVVVKDDGNILVTDLFSLQVFEVTTEGEVTVWAGSGINGSEDGPKESAQFQLLTDIVKDNYGNYFLSDDSKIRKVDTAGMVTTLAGSDDFGFVNGVGEDAQFNFIWGMGIDEDGNIYASDVSNAAIRKIDSLGQVTTVAGNGISGYVDGVGTMAQFNTPEDVAVDKDGNIYVADGQNFRVRKIDTNGEVSTIAGTGTPSNFFLDGGQEAIDGDGNFAQFGRLRGIMVKPNGNLLTTSWSNDAIREIEFGMPSPSLIVKEAKSDQKYRHTPIEHQNEFYFESTLENTTAETVEKVEMKVSVLLDNTVIFTSTSTPIDIPGMDEATLELEESLTLTSVGNYEVQYEYSTADERNFKTAFREIILTDSLMSNSDFFEYYIIGYQDFSADWIGKYGQEFELDQKDTLTGIYNIFYVEPNTTLQFGVYGVDGDIVEDEALYISEKILFDTSAFLTYTHQLPSELILDEGKYVFTVERVYNEGYLAMVWDTDFQSSGVWSNIPNVTNGWDRYQNLYGQDRVCGTMISPLFGSSNVVTSIPTTLTPNWEITVGPNPFVEEVTIKSNTTKNLNFQLLDLNGRIVNAFSNQGNGTLTKDLSSLPAGSYFLHCSDGEQRVIKRIVKQ